MSENLPLTTVGKIRDAHGLKGELFVVLFAKEASWAEKIKELYLTRGEPDSEGKHNEVTYTFKIKRLKPHKIGLIVKLDKLDDRTQAEGFRGAAVQIPSQLLTSKEGEMIFLGEVAGFEVEREGVRVGRISGFSSNGAQDLVVLETANGKFEVPFIPEFVTSIRWKEHVVQMNFPEGLLGEAD